MSIMIRIAVAVTLLSLVGCGKSGLSRSEAEEAIEKQLNGSADFPTVTLQVGEHYFSPPSDVYRLDSVCFSLMEDGRNPAGYVPYRHPQGRWGDWHAASEAGFVTATAQEFTGRFLGSDFTAIKCTIKLTDKAQKYVLKTEGGDNVTLKVVEGVEIDVTGVTKPADMFVQTVSEVEYTYTYKFNPLGKALAESSQKDSKPNEGKALFRLFDDGWRLE